MKTEPTKDILLSDAVIHLFPNGEWLINSYGKKIYLNVEDVRKILEMINGEKSNQFPELPEGARWHNPDNLTPEQVGVDKGWRLLLESEVNSRQVSGTSTDCDAWREDRWESGYYGCGILKTYRTKATFSTPQLSVSYKDQYGEKKIESVIDIELLGKRYLAGFLRKCRVIVLENPMDEPDPFGMPRKMIVVRFGVCEGIGEINPDMEFESYLDGKTFRLRNIVSIVP